MKFGLYLPHRSKIATQYLRLITSFYRVLKKGQLPAQNRATQKSIQLHAILIGGYSVSF